MPTPSKTFDQSLSEILDEFQEVYGTEITEVSFDAFKLVLKDCTPQELSFAAVEHLKACKFAPKPAELLAIIKAQRERDAVASTKQQFWSGTQAAAERKHTGAFNRPEGMSVIDYVEQLMAEGLTREEAANRICQ
jgi:hypothetical protein